MKLLVLTFESDRPEKAVFKGLQDAGVQVEVLCGANQEEVLSLRSLGLNASEFGVEHRFDIVAARELRRHLESGAYDVIYAPRNKTLACALMAARGFPKLKVVGYRGTIGHISRFDPASWMAYLNPRLHLTWCVSDAVRTYLIGCGIPQDRLVRIYKGHDPDWYRPADRSVLQALGIPDGAITVGFVGNMRPVKGVGHLLQAAAMLESGRDVHFLLVGEVRSRRILLWQDDPRLKGRLHFTGYRSDAASLMGCCDMFVMPSVEREGLPRAVIEAMAQAVAPVVTRVGGMPELVEEGVSGLVVPPRDATSLATAIQSLMSDEPKRLAMGQAARIRIQEHFHIRTTIATVLDTFQALTQAS